MSLFLQIKNDQLDARKNKNGIASSVLTTLIGEAGAVGKKERNGDPTDSEVTATIKKFIKNIDELLTHSPGNFQAIGEKAILVRYLPKQLTETEIRHILTENAFDFSDKKITGIVMALFKANYEGQYDAKIVSQLIKEFQV